MNKNLRWKVLTIFAVLALAVFFFYPPQQKVKLGLDLKGGVHLVLKVQTDDAVKLETEVTAERLRETMQSRGIFGATVIPEPPLRFRVTGVPQDKDAEFRRAGRRVHGDDVQPDVGRGGGVYLRPEAESGERAA